MSAWRQAHVTVLFTAFAGAGCLAVACVNPASARPARQLHNQGMTAPVSDLASPLAPTSLPWQAGFASLGPDFYTPQTLQPLAAPYWVGRNRALAQELGLPADWLDQTATLEALSGNALLPGSEPLASVYSGHQFGVWAGQLGDGRAMLLGELATALGGQEVQLKGAGRTPYSRMGDGRAVLRSSIREFLCSEALHGLGIPTTRALCVTGSDAPVRREEMETAAVVTRTAPSFIRFGHFEHFSYTGQHAQLKVLADFVIDRFYPACREAPQPYAALLQAVSERTAHLLAAWQAVGFCHGVMNTDNMSILGLTIDYGPFQFLDVFDPSHVCNHSDNQGRYAYNRQPNMAYWNLFCLGQALLPLISEQEHALAALESYKTVFPATLQARMRAKLGLPDEQEGDAALIEDTFRLLAANRVDYTIFWRRLCAFTPQSGHKAVRELFFDGESFNAWALQYSERIAPISIGLRADLMLKNNPKFVLRNHLGEESIQAAKLKDFSRVDTLLTLLQSPFEEHPGHGSFAGFPPDWASSIAISCSS